MKRGAEPSVTERNKRGRAAGRAAASAATRRGTALVNHGAGTMPVGAPAPHGGERCVVVVVVLVECDFWFHLI